MGDVLKQKRSGCLRAEESLRACKSHYQTILETLPHGIRMIDASGIITFSNSAHDRLFEWPPGEMLGTSIFDLQISQEVRNELRVLVKKAMEEELALETGVSENVTRYGRKIWVRTDWDFIRDEQGRALGLVSALTDVTEQKKERAESRRICRELERVVQERTSELTTANIRLTRETEERITANEALGNRDSDLRLLVENQTDMIVAFDTEGRLKFVSPSYCRTFGKTREELIGKAFIPLIHEDDREAVKEAIARVYAKPYRGYVEERAMTVDGWRWQAWLNTSILDENEAVSSIIAVGRDVTDRKDVEHRLKESEQRLGLALDAANLGMWEFNPTASGDTHFNDRWFTMLGYEPDELPHTAETWTSLLHPDDRDITRRRLEEHLKGGRKYSTEFRLKTKDGSYRWIHSFGKILERDESGIPSRMIGVHRDISDQKEAEEERLRLEISLRQAQKTEALGTLAGGIAHDFNNILASVLGYTELALDEVKEEERVRGFLEEVLVAGDRARNLVRQILTFSRLSAQEMRPIQIDPLVREAVKMLHSTIPENIVVREKTTDNSLSVHADPTQIYQVIVNLATNAAHAMAGDGGVMAIGVDRFSLDENSREKPPEASPGDYARITVSDTGMGITEKNIDLLFDPYFTTKAPEKGTGLGLAVVHGIVKTHNGHIAVKSEVGRGTSFHVYLPLTRMAKRDTTARPTAGLPRGTESILFVDDESAIGRIQKERLERLGYTVTVRSDSLEALETFRSVPDSFDLVITDMAMPYMTGDKLAREIKAIRSGIPVIICSGLGGKAINKEVRDLEIARILMKPIDHPTMAKAIRDVLDR
jgi:PAS domain S-box-containing protein